MFSSLYRLAAIILALSGSPCVAGQSVDYKFHASTEEKIAEGQTVSVEVRDDRPVVKSKDMGPDYIGYSIDGVGHHLPISTKDGQPLAELVKNDVTAELQEMGFTVLPAGEAQSLIEISIQDWNFNRVMRVKFWYGLVLSAVRSDGSVIVYRAYSDTKVVAGGFLTEAKTAFEREMPKIYAGLIHKMLREDQVLVSGLKGG